MFGKSNLMAALALAAASAGHVVIVGADLARDVRSDLCEPLLVEQRKARSVPPPSGYPRSKNKPTKRRLKDNRTTIGRRVRRKHRRAA